MATLYISEYKSVGTTKFTQHAQAPGDTPLAEQALAIGASSILSAALNAGTWLVRVVADTDCFLAFGDNTITAATGIHYLPAKAIEYYALSPGSFIAVHA